VRTIAIFLLSMVLSLLFTNACPAIQVTENLATLPARRPQWISRGDKLMLSWVTPLRLAPDTGMLTDNYMQMRYAVIAEKDKPLPKYPVKGKARSVPSRSMGKFTFYRITQDKADPNKVFLIDVYDDGSNIRQGLDVHVRKILWNGANDTLAVDANALLFPPRMPDDEYGKSPFVVDGFPRISYIEPCLVVDNAHWLLSFLDRPIPDDNGKVYCAESMDGGKTWGAVSCIITGNPQLQAVDANDGAYYIASVILELTWPLLPTGRFLHGWPDDEYDKNAERGYIPYCGKLWVSKVSTNIEKPLTQLIDPNDNVNGVAVLALKDVVYVVYARGDESRGSIWIVKSMGQDQWSKPVQLTAEKACLDREPCITQFNNEIWIAFARSYNGKASVLEYVKLDNAVFGEEK